MIVNMAYGENGLKIELPDETEVLEPEYVEGVPDPEQAISNALNDPINSEPLGNIISEDDKVVIVHSDITRATPNHIIQPVLVNELLAAGVKKGNIAFLNALGTHRPQTQEELERLLGKDIARNYECLQHNCSDETDLVEIGVTSFGNRLRINRRFMEADIKILTGFIEPHLFAGFSGGPKGVLPSIAGFESVVSNHGAEMISHPNATWGITEDNPIWDEMMEAAIMTGPDFLVNVTLNRNKEITGVFAGELKAAHKKGRKFCAKSAMVSIEKLYDVVITTNSGYPLDLNLYQAVKGITAAAPAVKKGGSIILVSECREGLPEFGKYAELLRSVSTPREALDKINTTGFHMHDQWQVQKQATIQLEKDIYVYSDGLTYKQIRDALMEPVRDINAKLEELKDKYGRDMSIAVLPEGPQVIPYINE